MLFNLSELALEESAQVQLKHPATGELLFADKEKTQIVGIEIEGEASASYRAAIDARSRKYLALKGKSMTPEDIRQNDVDLFAALSIRGINFSYNGKELATEEDFRELYQDPKYLWVNKQIDAAIGDISNFLKQ